MNNTTALLPHLKLRLNIDHPSFEESYVFGYECAVSEVSEDENPYEEGSQEYNQWQEGWWAGFYGEEPLFRLDDVAENQLVGEGIAANDQSYSHEPNSFITNFLNITSALTATMIIGYQILDLVA